MLIGLILAAAVASTPTAFDRLETRIGAQVGKPLGGLVPSVLPPPLLYLGPNGPRLQWMAPAEEIKETRSCSEGISGVCSSISGSRSPCILRIKVDAQNVVLDHWWVGGRKACAAYAGTLEAQQLGLETAVSTAKADLRARFIGGSPQALNSLGEPERLTTNDLPVLRWSWGGVTFAGATVGRCVLAVSLDNQGLVTGLAFSGPSLRCAEDAERLAKATPLASTPTP